MAGILSVPNNLVFATGSSVAAGKTSLTLQVIGEKPAATKITTLKGKTSLGGYTVSAITTT